MRELLVIVEHRNGEINECTYQILWKAHQLRQELSINLTAVVLGNEHESLTSSLAERADRIIVYGDDRLRDFNGDYYAEILKTLIEEERPFITMIGHTPWGMDFAPSLSIKSSCPLASDCVDILIEDETPKVIRQIYGGKLLSKVGFKESEGYIITIRPGAFPSDRQGDYHGEIVKREFPEGLPEPHKRFIDFRDTAAGDVDITLADLLVSIGRGIGEEDNIELIKELAEKMGATLSCSRPVVDKGWLPKYLQVGTSGKSVKPKIYLALGISGSFQHIAGISGAGTIIAVNKDKKAPIFRIADYGIVDDLFKIASALNEKLG